MRFCAVRRIYTALDFGPELEQAGWGLVDLPVQIEDCHLFEVSPEELSSVALAQVDSEPFEQTFALFRAFFAPLLELDDAASKFIVRGGHDAVYGAGGSRAYLVEQTRQPGQQAVIVLSFDRGENTRFVFFALPSPTYFPVVGKGYPLRASRSTSIGFRALVRRVFPSCGAEDTGVFKAKVGETKPDSECAQ